jgi:hypothetical protein
VGLDRGTHAGAPGADDEHVVRCFHRHRSYRTKAPTCLVTASPNVTLEHCGEPLADAPTQVVNS